MIDSIRAASSSIGNGLLRTCIPGLRWPLAIAAFSADQGYSSRVDHPRGPDQKRFQLSNQFAGSPDRPIQRRYRLKIVSKPDERALRAPHMVQSPLDHDASK